MSQHAFRIIAPPHTPLHSDGSLNLQLIERQAEVLIESQVDGVFVAGTTGESASLTLGQRQAIAERWIEVTRSTDLQVLVQVGHNCQQDAAELAAHAQKIGADGLACHAPSFFRPAGVEQLIEFLAPIARAAEDLPFYYYDIPVMTGVELPTSRMLEQAKPRMPNLVGVKFSRQDFIELQQCVAADDGTFEILFGSDEMLLAAYALGVEGAVGSTYNVIAPLYRAMLAAAQAGDWSTARQQQRTALRFVQILKSYGFAAASKAAMQLCGLDLGPVLPPLAALSADLQRKLLAELEPFQEYCRPVPATPKRSAPAAI